MPAPTASKADVDVEYGQYVATQPIDIGFARAFNPGDPVPASTVAANPEWVDDKLVAKTTTKAAAAATEDAASAQTA
jgi:hypothetical protein